ncbi:MAG TPA: hypothetical protein DCG47_03510 [Spirochaetaceae bacterium]|jgi:fermentation-respiration switch protein FrsA (DUF1100 family)|nr:hypothetical protein [Spirochaetaceae bacterium]
MESAAVSYSLVSAFIAVALLIAGAALLAILIVAWMLSRRVSDPGRRQVEPDLIKEAEKGYIDLAAWSSLQRERFIVRSPFGYGLACEWLCAPGNKPPKGTESSGTTRTHPVAVIAHGHGYDRAGSAKYAAMFLESGWDAIIYDHRACGDSGGSGTTMGYYESGDLGAIIEALRMRLGAHTPIGAMGESMGAATVLLFAAQNPGALAFAIADCSYSDLPTQLAFLLKADYRLPAFPFMAIADFITRLRLGYSWQELSPRKAIEAAGGLPGLPLLIIHGEDDDYVPPAMAKELAAVKREPVELMMVPGARHAKSWETDREGYARKVKDFIGRIAINDELDRSDTWSIWQPKSL